MTQARNSVRHVHSSLRCREFLYDGKKYQAMLPLNFPVSADARDNAEGPPFFLEPNARLHLLPEAGAQRTL
jgi:hypothetical protein